MRRNNATAPPKILPPSTGRRATIEPMASLATTAMVVSVSTAAGHPPPPWLRQHQRQGRSLVLTGDGLEACMPGGCFPAPRFAIHFSTLFLAAISLLTRAHWPPWVTRAYSISPLAMPGGYRCKTQPTRRQRHASVDSLARHRPPRRCHARPKQLDRSHQGRIQPRLRPVGPRPDPDSTAIRTSVPVFLCSFVRHGPLFVSSWETIAVCSPASWPLFRPVVYRPVRPIACIAEFRWRC